MSQLISKTALRSESVPFASDVVRNAGGLSPAGVDSSGTLKAVSVLHSARICLTDMTLQRRCSTDALLDYFLPGRFPRTL